MKEHMVIAKTAATFDEFDNVRPVEPIRSPLNYIGGKYKLLPQILKFFPKDINSFVDLFCGGCNVGVNVNADSVVFNDNLIYLIDLYRSLKSTDIDQIMDHIHSRITDLGLSLTNTEGYIRLRSLYNLDKNPLDLFVLVAFSFNHQIRFNSAHQFNNPFGKERSCYNQSMERNLRRFVDRIQSMNCSFSSSDFDKYDISNLSCRDFVYCDPPYLITTGTYNDGKRGFTGWSVKEERQLLAMLDFLNSQNVKFALSNVLTHKGKTNTLLIDWVSRNGYRVEHLAKSYANSSYHTIDRRFSSSDEVLILNY